MARTKRTQVLMDPDEYARLEEIAARRGCSVAELIRAAVREAYLTVADDRFELVESITSMNLQVGDWESIEKEIEEAHGAGVH